MWNRLNAYAVVRVFQAGGQAAGPLLAAVLLRVADRILSLAPLLAVASWLWLAQPAFSVAALAGVLVAALAVQLLLAVLAQAGMFRHSYQLISHYRRVMINRVRQLPLMQTRGQHASAYSERLTEDINQLEGAFTHLLPELLASLLLVFVLLVVLLLCAPLAGVVMLAGLSVAGWLLQRCQQRFSTATQARKQQSSEVSGVLLEFITGLVTLRLFAATDWFKARLQPGFQQMHDTAMTVEMRGALPVMLARLVLELSFLVVLAVLCWQLPLLAAERLLAVVLVSYPLLDAGREFFTQLTMLRYTLQSEQRIEQLTRQPVLPEPLQPAEPHGLDIELCNVSYRYPGTDTDILHGVSVTIPAGSRTALLGRSGCGKSTLLALLARFDDPQQGEIRLGTVPLPALGSARVQQLISMVFQDVQLTGGSIRDNILLAAPQVNAARFEQVCQLSGCALLAQRLPDGLDTVLGEQGQPLSGGERQCIALARALLGDAPIILLDEATASLDIALQTQVLEGLETLASGRTLITVAHRLETVRNMDQTLQLSNGQLHAVPR